LKVKLARKILGIVILAGLIAVGILAWSFKLHELNDAAPRQDESYSQKIDRWRSSAELLMLKQSSNDVVGFSRLVDSHIDTLADNVRSWSGEVTVDYVNHLGGIDRTNVRYAFDSALGNLSCFATLQICCHDPAGARFSLCTLHVVGATPILFNMTCKCPSLLGILLCTSKAHTIC
jgi:hypothetical protein